MTASHIYCRSAASVPLLLLLGCATAARFEPARFRRETTAVEIGLPESVSTGPVQQRSADLFDMLVENGALTPEQAEQLRTSVPAAKPATEQDSPTFRVGPTGLRFESADHETTMRIGGRLHADATAHTPEHGLDENEITDGTELRRARFELSGTLPSDVSWAAEVDFADNQTSIKDFRMAVDVSESALVSIGNQKQPYSLAVEESSNDLPFVERSIDNDLIISFIDRAIGVRAQGHTDQLFYAGGLFGGGVSPGAVDDESWGVAGRVVFAPVVEEDRILHLGLRGAYRQPDDGTNAIRLRDESTHMSSFSVVDTGTILDVDQVTLYGPEFVYVQGPLSIGGEYNQLVVGRDGEDLDFTSWHVFATACLTGETRAAAYRLDEGEFKRMRADDASGAWEVAARLAELDLNDVEIAGGAERATSLALNWYWKPNVRYMLNWTHVLDTDGGSATTADAAGLDVYTLRLQLTF